MKNKKSISAARIMIIGRPGSGKSTLALRLAQKLKLPLYHLDKYFFVENWAKRDYEEFLAIQQNIIDQERWIIDGCSIKSLEMRYARAQICIYLLYPRWLCLYRLIKRIFTKNPAIDDRAQGCDESISWELIKYMWTFEYRENNRVERLLTDLQKKYSYVHFYIVRNNAELSKFFNLLCEK